MFQFHDAFQLGDDVGVLRGQVGLFPGGGVQIVQMGGGRALLQALSDVLPGAFADDKLPVVTLRVVVVR